MTKPEISDAVVQEIRELGYDSQKITHETKMVDDLGFDSLDNMDLVMRLEERFNVSVPDEEAEGITTVGDIVNLVAEKLT